MMDHKELKIKINIKHIKDLRNYKVSIEKAQNVLSFKPNHKIEDIIKELFEHIEKFNDFNNPQYYNIKVFKQLDKGII